MFCCFINNKRTIAGQQEKIFCSVRRSVIRICWLCSYAYSKPGHLWFRAVSHWVATVSNKQCAKKFPKCRKMFWRILSFLACITKPHSHLKPFQFSFHNCGELMLYFVLKICIQCVIQSDHKWKFAYFLATFFLFPTSPQLSHFSDLYCVLVC